MSKPLWWKNAVKVIKKFTTDNSYMTFDCYDDQVIFMYNVEIEGARVVFEEMVSIDILQVDNLQETLIHELHESFRSMLMDYIHDLDYNAIVGL